MSEFSKNWSASEPALEVPLWVIEQMLRISDYAEKCGRSEFQMKLLDALLDELQIEKAKSSEVKNKGPNQTKLALAYSAV